MRLINVKALKLEEFFGSQLLELDYAILSHTWVAQEVTFHEMQSLTKSVRSKAGYSKMYRAAMQAKGDGLDWIWVDTCCIDKTSSA